LLYLRFHRNLYQLLKFRFLNYLILLGFILFSSSNLLSQVEVPIINYQVNSNGQVELRVNSSPLKYYILKVRHNNTSAFDLSTSLTPGKAGTTIITESLGNYPVDHYQVIEYSTLSPGDIDGDGINDIQEYNQIPEQNPLNPAAQITINNGLVAIDSLSTYNALSLVQNVVPWSEYLNGKVYVKFIIVDFLTGNPRVYFINTETHNLHSDFSSTIGIDNVGDQVKRGQIIYHPTSISNNGTLGTFAFNFSGAEPEDFSKVQKTHELLARSMPFLKNNFSYFITENNEEKYEEDFQLYESSRIPILLEADIYANVNYWGLHPAESFGFFKQVESGEMPGPKDIILYEIIPNALPRVGGIMTSVIQTPLSHVNLRAIQNNIPNAYIRDPLSVDSVAALLNHYVYFKVEQDKYTIREASIEEVNAWYENIRPSEDQIPPLNLSYTEIKSLDDIQFDMFDGFGAKCANVATLGRLGLPEGTTPAGYGIPFYFYVEFMKHNNLFEQIGAIIRNDDFKNNRDLRDLLLDGIRDRIKDSEMPQWMLDELSELQLSFPEGTSIRCRSSANNEDLPGFNGAGLYDSKTQHPDEGHISKSIKQVYASLWNLRAFEERDFYRVDHFSAAMGVLCHPNTKNEKLNGVGVSTDPIYNSQNTFYLNSQLGEELITNPELTSFPEEILIDRSTTNGNDFIVIQRSNLAPSDTILFGPDYITLMRIYLSKIHDQFAILYRAVNNETFAMDIEYKITEDNRLIIKQARPWVSYVYKEEIIDLKDETNDILLFPNPAQNYLSIKVNDENITSIRIMDITGKEILSENISKSSNSILTIYIENLPAGIYILSGIIGKDVLYYSKKFIKL